MNGVSYGTSTGAWTNVSGTPYINWFFRRAPGVMDVVGFTGTGADRSVAHNLGVVPELIILKNRTSVNAVENYWLIGTNFGASTYRRNWLQTTDAGTSYAYSAGAGFSAAPTATTFGVTGAYNTSTNPIVAYLFASCPGVSKVGSYTGNGSSLTVNCGFSGGARFVLIKRVDSTGDWLVWDTARGIVAANDPYLRLNSTPAEFAGDDSVDPDSAGFIVNQNVNTNINVTSATYIYLAFA